MSSLFTVDGDGFIPTEHARGPWSPDLLHGGPVSALLAHHLEASDVADQLWFPARFTVDFMRPLAMAPMRVTAEVVRAGRRAQLLDARLHVGDKLVARASLQQIRCVDVPVGDAEFAKAWTASPPEPPESISPSDGMGEPGTAFHSSSVQHRSRDGLLTEVGPSRDWIHVDVPLLPDVGLSPFERVVAAADFGNGVSASLPFDRYTFVNADLTVHLFRLPVDEWVLLDAVTRAGDDGIGMAESQLSDRLGVIGRSCQSLVIDRR
jgi:hypothetical protein